MTREDVVFSILVDQDMKKIEREVEEGIRKEKESNGLAVAIIVVVIVVLIFVAISAM